MQKYFSKNLRFLRKKQNLTQLDLAEFLGKTKGLISCYEKGTAEPGMDVLLRISHKLGVNLHDLCTKDLSTDEKFLTQGELTPNLDDFKERLSLIKQRNAKTDVNGSYSEAVHLSEEVIEFLQNMDKRLLDASSELESVLNALRK
ncbi:helix-turn-helix domain-containing protein [Roseivirga sp. BDSF3-8]|uniref:helix-turn-helix domain-containing protein n=1 Tax=Roseivirga sp. BDSF3-8 TaxID=3241598 RepID=UPI003531BF95